MPEYLIKYHRNHGEKARGRAPYVIAEELLVLHPMIFRQKGRQSTIAGIPINRMEPTGRRDRKRLEIVVRKGTTARGVETAKSRHRADAEATAAGVKKVIRQLRPQEAEAIEQVDAEIRAIEDALSKAKDRREELVRTAWSKAHVVRLGDMEQLAVEGEAALEKMQEEAS